MTRDLALVALALAAAVIIALSMRLHAAEARFDSLIYACGARGLECHPDHKGGMYCDAS